MSPCASIFIHAIHNCCNHKAKDYRLPKPVTQRHRGKNENRVQPDSNEMSEQNQLQSGWRLKNSDDQNKSSKGKEVTKIIMWLCNWKKRHQPHLKGIDMESPVISRLIKLDSVYQCATQEGHFTFLKQMCLFNKQLQLAPGDKHILCY